MKRIAKILLSIILISNILPAISINVRVPRIGLSVGSGSRGSSESDDSGSGTVNRTSDAYIINGAGHDKKIKLDGERVEITGASNTLTITGKVSSITIVGAGNTVYVDSVESVSITGASTVVLYKTSPTKSGVPSTKVSGAGSYVKKQ